MTDSAQVLSRDSYLLFIELRLFWAVAFIYGLSLLLFLFHVFTRLTGPARAGRFLIWTGGVAHAALLTLRAFEAGRFPALTFYEGLMWFSCAAALTYLYNSEAYRGVYLPGAFVAAISFGASLYALFALSPAVEPLSPGLQSRWFAVHVALVFLSYAVLSVSASIEASYLVAAALLRRGRGAYGFTEAMLEDFHALSFRLVSLAFPILTLAIFSGAAWTGKTWGQYRNWEASEIWSIVTWTVFTLYLHSMSRPSTSGARASIFNLMGFACIVMAVLGAGWLAALLGMPGPGAYAL